jgi:hypothetical protein
MPTRSIKVKLIVSRRDGGQPLRRALWSTHEAVNAATRYYEERLLLMRGEAYRLGEEEITQSSVMDSLTELIKQAVLRNGGTPGDDNEDAVTLLRQLYEHIVPSSIEKDGTAQAAAAYIGPLTDPASQGFWGVYDKLARQKPNWVTLVDEDDGLAVFKLAVDDTEALAVAKAWLSTPNANEWMSDTGSPATWMRQARKGEAEWPDLGLWA